MRYSSCVRKRREPETSRARLSKRYKTKARQSRYSLRAPMWFMSPHTIPGWFTDIPSSPGRAGTHIPESGLVAPTFRSESVLESASSEVMDGAGAIGDLIGTTITQFTTTTGTTPGATRFTTGAITTAAEASGELQGTCSAARATTVAAEFITGPAGRRDRSKETPRLLEDSLLLGVKAASGRALSATTTMAGRRGAIRRAEAPASVAERAAAGDPAAAADLGNRDFFMFPVDREI